MGSVDRKVRRVLIVSIESLESRQLLTSLPVDGTQVPLTGVKVGDTITVQSYVSTATDPNEDGEGENVLISAVGSMPSTTPVYGVDASYANGDVDWAARAAQGTQFTLIRAADGSHADSTFDDNFVNASDAGIAVSPYYFAEPGAKIGPATSAAAAMAEANAEADEFAATAGPYLTAGTLQPALDIEDPHLGKMTNQQIADFITNWNTRLQQDLPTVSLTPFVYTTRSIAHDRLAGFSALSTYPLWLSDINSNDPLNNPDPRLSQGLGPWSNYSIIQYVTPKRGSPTVFDQDFLNSNVALSSLAISAGSFSANDSTFNTTINYSFIATSPDEVITASIPNADGDETAIVNATFAAASPFSLAPGQYAAFTSLSGGLDTSAAGEASTAAALTLGVSPLSLGITRATWASAALQAVCSADANALTQDPPDANFTAIARPARPVTTIFSRASDFKGLKTAGALASSIDALELNEEKLNNLIVASTTTSNRIDGAVAAGNTRWAVRQSVVLKSYAKQESVLLASQPSLSQRESAQLAKAGLGSTTVAAADVQNFEQGVLDNGLPAAFVSVLNKLGISQSLQTSIQQALFVQDTDTASGSYASIVTNAALESDLEEAGLLLKNG